MVLRGAGLPSKRMKKPTLSWPTSRISSGPTTLARGRVFPSTATGTSTTRPSRTLIMLYSRFP